MTSTGGLKEVHSASGGGWGGTLVDEAFKDLLCEVVGKELYLKFMKQETDDWIYLWRTFEEKKKTIGPATTGKIIIRFPLSLRELYKTQTQQDLEDRIAETKYSSQMHLSGDKIRVDSNLMQGLFTKSTSLTVSHVKSILNDSNVRDTKIILMVGGFSDSLMLQEAIKKEFSYLKIIIPRETSSAILRGAVIFGHNPKSIFQRVLKKTYGVGKASPFIEGVHEEKYKTKTERGMYCDQLFGKHVEIGQSVNVSEAQNQNRYWADSADSKELNVLVFASDLKDPMYIDRGCELVGKFTVDISDVPGGLDRSVLVSLTFSDTEIKATAVVEKTGEKVTASFDFLG